MLSPSVALERLREGNRRFVSGERQRPTRSDADLRRECVSGQAPFAVILGCSDSRVPVELLFDQSLGDLFVVRVAGNIAEPSQIGSIEFAVEQLRTRLIVVLGHGGCGAVRASLAQVQQPGQPVSPHLDLILESVRPAVVGALDVELERGREFDQEAVIARAVRENVRTQVQAVREGSPAIARAIEEQGARLVGADYVMASGAVEFFMGLEQDTA